MKNIGKYNGVPCYECSNAEYRNIYESGTDNGKQIFIVDGTMVQKNVIIGHYDGKHVKDVYDNVPFIVKKSPAPQKPMTTASEATGTEIKEINYSDYTKVVDDFFASLDS